MDCRKAQRLIDELRSARLGDSLAREVQCHVRECSDCRVAQQRALHLQQLLAIKRHETPGADYFENFLGDFQRRLAAATAPRPTFWQRLCTRLHLEPVPRLRYGFAHALGVAFAVALVSRALIVTDLGPDEERRADNDGVTPRLATSSLPAPSSTPKMIASALPVRVPEVIAANLFVPPALAPRPVFDTPRYILDRYNLTPASYEVASFHF